ncbi:MAG: Holliday junction branch migration protein RuvA [Alphaproteobacteria bacterium]|nr:Holliday junction branch migration protein RuvA [Alphaproteobacteria bacterium]
MIAKLRGVIDTIGEDYCIVDVNGVGYLVSASSRTLAKLVRGKAAVLLIETVVREDSISLFGFADAWEKEWFLTLTKVQGVGAKVCLAILSVLTPNQLAQAVSAQDKASFSRASGVGPKLAARIVTELKDKIVTVPIESVVRSDLTTEEEDMDKEQAEQENNAYEDVISAQEDNQNSVEDAISALVNLGYQRLEAYKAVNKAAMKTQNADVSELIKLALKEFANKEI